jgi:hypothetical protein
MTGEPTEIAGVAEADTEHAYAWAPDFHDADEVLAVADIAERHRC